MSLKFQKKTYHSDDLEVLQVCSLCGQNLFGNEIGLIGGISLRWETSVNTRAVKKKTQNF